MSNEPKSGGFFTNLLFNILLPVVILTRFSGEESLGPVWGIVIALAFPIGYGLWEMRQTNKVNVFSVIGVISVLLTGGISLLQLDPKYIAIKEAAVPALLGVAVLISQFTRFPLVRTLIFNAQLFAMDKVQHALKERGTAQLLERRLRLVSYIITASFMLSAVLNYVLAKLIVVSQPGTTAFSEELGKMTLLSYPVIALPSTVILMGAIFYLLNQLRKLTGLDMEELLAEKAR
ncbi:MFS transporter [Saccharospirillum sp. MSK14-1]|uniref:VC0807 family protein n=1 Tax=Saccharospirillum sp. MSK14-1 TaxID=1897632 RepID=UPI000D3839F1|nr:VC0807 family protein [Saccharospirillum sp. MSK14-1]PTY36848.1 MFS transporter [Saccharospirillum sp. MSK14-1]